MVRSPKGVMVEKRVGPSGRGGQSAERRFGTMRAGWERTELAARGSPARFTGEDHEGRHGSDKFKNIIAASAQTMRGDGAGTCI